MRNVTCTSCGSKVPPCKHVNLVLVLALSLLLITIPILLAYVLTRPNDRCPMCKAKIAIEQDNPRLRTTN